MAINAVPNPPDWQELYSFAMIELNPLKLPQRIADARNAILDRIEKTITKASNYNERQQLNDALNGLRVLRQEYDRRVQQYGEPRTGLRDDATHHDSKR
jgi:hypothetical protein